MFHPRGPTFFELVRQALSSTERGYDLLAAKFDRTPFRTPEVVLDAAAEILAERQAEDALDLCCGTGAALEMLRPLCRRRVVGVDFSLGMLAEARRRVPTRAPGTARVELVRADVLTPVCHRAFDIVTCFGAIGHFRHNQHHPLIAAAKRALRPGGCFVFATAERPPLGSRRLWLAAGFDAVMKVRNAFWRPPFVMYYLNFLLPRARKLLADHGFDVTVHRSPVAAAPWMHLVVAEWLSPSGRVAPTKQNSTSRRSVDRRS